MRTFHGVTLSWETVEDVLEVRLHRGPCNEIGTPTLRELEQLAEHLKAGAGGAKALLWWSDQPRGFSAGADLTELYEGMRRLREGTGRQLLGALLSRDDPTEEGPLSTLREMARDAVRRGGRSVVAPLVARRVRSFIHRIHAAFDTFDTVPLPTVAAIHGVCFGGGFELALTADVRIADKTARFAFPELRLGIVPGFGGLPRLERDVGNATVRDLLLTGRSLRAQRAHELGIVAQVVGRGKAVAVARATARQATRFRPEVVAHAKRFAKPLPRERLDAEIETFLTTIRTAAVEDALERFVTRTDPRPYLP